MTSSSNGNGAAPAAPASLAENEAIIEKGLKSFVEVGRALMAIRDGQQYKATHATFEAYLQERWQMSRPRAYQLIESAQTAEDLSTNVDIPIPSTEGVTRELKGTPEQKAEAWKATTERFGSKPTAKQTRKTVSGLRGRGEHQAPTPKPEDPRNRHGKKPTKAERRGVLWKLHDTVMEFTAQLERIDPRVINTDDPDDLEALIHIRDAMISFEVWRTDVLQHLQKKIGDEAIREKIAALRNPAGKYPAEIKRCREVADRLERQLNNRLPS